MALRSFKTTYTISNELNESETFYSDTTGVYVWGASTNGGATTFAGDAGRIPDLNNVKQIYATDLGFAALLSDGSVYVWGDPTGVGEQGFITVNNLKLTNVKTIRSTSYAFAAILNDGGVVVWGRGLLGGNPYYQSGDPIYSPPVLVSELSNIKAIYSTNQSFSALSENGEVWAWGFLTNQTLPIYKVNTSTNIKTITGNYTSFAGLREDGTVCVWGVPNGGGEIGPGQGAGIIPGLNNVKKIYATNIAFAALRNDGTVYIWGNINNGGSLDNTLNTSYQNIPISNILNMYSNEGAFIAQLSDRIYVWGNPAMGGNPNYSAFLYNPGYIPDIYNVCATSQAFAGITSNNRVYVWGKPNMGGSNIYNNSSGSGLISLIDNVSAITASGQAFTVISDNKIIRWGEPLNGGGTTGNPEIVPGISNPIEIYANNASFLSVSPEQSYFVWGFSLGGGDNSQISGLTNFVNLTKNNSGAYAALEKPIPPQPIEEKSALSSTNATILGIVLAVILFASFYLISNFVEDLTTKVILLLIALGIIATATVLVILFV